MPPWVRGGKGEQGGVGKGRGGTKEEGHSPHLRKDEAVPEGQARGDAGGLQRARGLGALCGDSASAVRNRNCFALLPLSTVASTLAPRNERTNHWT